METKLFEDIAKKLTQRRPAWQFIIEDNVVRILTHQFQVNWSIITEILVEDKNMQVVEVTHHSQLGSVITMQSNLGT